MAATAPEKGCLGFWYLTHGKRRKSRGEKNKTLLPASGLAEPEISELSVPGNGLINQAAAAGIWPGF